MTRALVSTTAAAALLLGGAFAGIASEDARGTTAPHAGVEKTLDEVSPDASGTNAEILTYDGGVKRVAGGNRYATAVAIAKAYGWNASNTVVVYIASGQQFPDALALGPSTTGNGPLLFVRQDGIPVETQRMLTTLKPCYIDVVGGPTVVSDAVYRDLKQFANPTRCGS